MSGQIMTGQVTYQTGPNGGLMRDGVEYVGGPCGSMISVEEARNRGIRGDMPYRWSGQIVTSTPAFGGLVRSGYSPAIPYSGQQSNFAEHDLNCGSVGGPYPPYVCSKCGTSMSDKMDDVSVHFWPRVGTTWLYYCAECADFNSKSGQIGFDRKGESILRDFMKGLPWSVVADWCDDNGRQPDAEWIRKYRSGK